MYYNQAADLCWFVHYTSSIWKAAAVHKDCSDLHVCIDVQLVNWTVSQLAYHLFTSLDSAITIALAVNYNDDFTSSTMR